MIDWLIGAGFLALVVVVYLFMRAGWKARGRRQAGVSRPPVAPGDDVLGPATLEKRVFYVATSKNGDPLDRIVVGGLGFRGRATVSVHPTGIRLAIAGNDPILIEPAALREVGRATWTIDRVVETDGLVLVGWRLGDLDVDTYLRDSTDPHDLIDAMNQLITTTGNGAETAPGTTTGEKTP
ncbi:PH-like domain-containing protein [Frondihabitans cladoniiphilus]|uniref:PH domain-containing protein n=1 Tax=Frondihabitans cladoniiphilus TaxID=715785 RepID=A0ABP8VRB6_9MICO